MSNVIPIFGTLFGVGLNLSPSVLFYEYNKGKRELNTIPEIMFITGVLSCTMNSAYGILEDDLNIKINSIVCTIIQLMYATIYLYLYSNKRIVKFFIYVFIVYDLTFEILYVFINALPYHLGELEKPEKPKTAYITGSITSVITVLNAGAPGQKIREVWKTGDYLKIPIFTSIAQFFCSGIWACYGFIPIEIIKIQSRIMIIITNVLGLILSAIQIVSYFYFYVTKKKNAPKSKKNKEDNQEEEEEEETVDENEKVNSSNLIEYNVERYDD